LTPPSRPGLTGHLSAILEEVLRTTDDETLEGEEMR